MMRQMASCECKSQDWQLAYSWFGQMKVSWFWLQNRQSCDKAIRVASRYRTTDRQFLFYCFGDMLGQPIVQTKTGYTRLHVWGSRSEIPRSCHLTIWAFACPLISGLESRQVHISKSALRLWQISVWRIATWPNGQCGIHEITKWASEQQPFCKIADRP